MRAFLDARGVALMHMQSLTEKIHERDVYKLGSLTFPLALRPVSQIVTPFWPKCSDLSEPLIEPFDIQV